MPTPPSGVEGVVNEEPVTGGQSPEPDDRLRERAKHELERRGNATLNAIRFAVLEVDGVEGVEVVDHSMDDTVALGEVRVRYSGGDRGEVARAVEGTRAAGILARLDEIAQVLISGTFYLIPEPDAPPTAAGPFLAAVAEAINALAIGAPLSVRRLNALAYNVPGLADVAEAQLEHDRGGEAGQRVTDPLLIGPSELVRPDETNLEAVLVSALKVPQTQDNELDVQLVDADENPIEWENFSIDVAVTLRAYLETAPTQPPERIGSLTKTLNFEGTSTATLEITAQDVDDLEPGPTDSHRLTGVEVELAAAVYPGILGAEGATIDLPDGT
jgi:Baseplate J-like protein